MLKWSTLPSQPAHGDHDFNIAITQLTLLSLEAQQQPSNQQKHPVLATQAVITHTARAFYPASLWEWIHVHQTLQDSHPSRASHQGSPASIPCLTVLALLTQSREGRAVHRLLQLELALPLTPSGGGVTQQATKKGQLPGQTQGAPVLRTSPVQPHSAPASDFVPARKAQPWAHSSAQPSSD